MPIVDILFNPRFSISLLLLSLILLSNCNKDDDDNVEDVVNTVESICAEEFTYKLNAQGLQDTFNTSLEIDNSMAEFELKELPIPKDDNLYRVLTLRSTSDSINFHFDLEVRVEDENSCIPLRTYNTFASTTSEGILDFEYSRIFSDVFINYSPIPQIAGTLEVTECDFESGTISGKFDVIIQADGDHPFPVTFASLRLSSGVFEDVCLLIE